MSENHVAIDPCELVVLRNPPVNGKILVDISDPDRIVEAVIVAYHAVKKTEQENEQLRKRLYAANKLIDKLQRAMAVIEVSTREHWSSIVRTFGHNTLEKLNKAVE